ncbi:chitinase [Gregarina niphandrodes]|uniref:Chitinase n=1 Tax=Gregarina niphandrodes TaxID=110365 RepID=A0A023B831_GRENI|nr:chitinase [Gregarina niphandrodes]EZG68171.1 chitinase [Gregarina niphandrodes]|eukprot:XP_011130065.1 chitinase [Gregarina niphandrodes]
MRLVWPEIWALPWLLGAEQPTDPWVVLYVEDWPVWVREFGFGTVEKYVLSRDLPVTNIALQIAFTQFNPSTCEMLATDADADFSKEDPENLVPAGWPAGNPDGTETGAAGGNIPAAQVIKSRYPYIKLIPSIGGWSRSHTYHDCLTNRMDETINNLVETVRVWGFDGADFDWEYPECEGGCGCQGEETCINSSNVAAHGDWELYKTFIMKLRAKFDELETKVGRKLMISGAFGMNPKLIDGGNETWQDPTPWEWLCDEGYFDLLNLMTYDFYGPWAPQVAPLAPLYSDPEGPTEMMSCDDSIQRILPRCSHPERLLMGLATYGKVWKDVPKEGTPPGMYKNSTNNAPMGPGSWELGTISIWDTVLNVEPVCEVAMHDTTKTKAAYCDTMPAQADSAAAGNGPARTADKVFISYEDGDTWKEKMAYAKEKGMGGAIIWAASDMGNGKTQGTVAEGLLNGLFSGWYGSDYKVGPVNPHSGTWPTFNKWPWYPCPFSHTISKDTNPADYLCPDLSTLPDFTPLPTASDTIDTGKDGHSPGPGPTTDPGGDTDPTGNTNATDPSGDTDATDPSGNTDGTSAPAPSTSKGEGWWTDSPNNNNSSPHALTLTLASGVLLVSCLAFYP